MLALIKQGKIKTDWGKNRKTSTFFSIPEDTKLTSKLFFGSNQQMKSKGILLIKILVLCPPELEFCGFRKKKKILKS